MQIVKIEYLSDAHGEAGHELCERCGRMVRWLATLSDGSVMGLECAKTSCLSEEVKIVNGRVRVIKEFWDHVTLSDSDKIILLREASYAVLEDNRDWLISADTRRENSQRAMAWAAARAIKWNPE